MVSAPEELELVVLPRIFERIKGFKLKRMLQNIPHFTVGPFVAFDHFGPVTFGIGQGLDAGPHPHVGMATLTYLFEGSLLHRDSMGNAQTLEPGGANFMLCGRGVAHSERTPVEARQHEARLNGAQLWLGLPRAHEEDAPGFEHHSPAALPVIESNGARLRIIAGTFGGKRSPVGVLLGTLCVDAELAAGARLVLPAEHQERAAYIVSGEIALGNENFTAERMLVFRPGKEVTIIARTPSRLLLLGGERLDGPRYISSTIVASARERIERAKADWSEGRIPSVVGEAERGAWPPM